MLSWSHSSHELALVAWEKESGALTSSAAPQTQILDFELAHPNICPIWELVERMTGHEEHSFGISLTQDNSRISGSSFGEGPVLMVYQKPEPSTRPTLITRSLRN